MKLRKNDDSWLIQSLNIFYFLFTQILLFKIFIKLEEKNEENTHFDSIIE